MNNNHVADAGNTAKTALLQWLSEAAPAVLPKTPSINRAGDVGDLGKRVRLRRLSKMKGGVLPFQPSAFRYTRGRGRNLSDMHIHRLEPTDLARRLPHREGALNQGRLQVNATPTVPGRASFRPSLSERLRRDGGGFPACPFDGLAAVRPEPGTPTNDPCHPGQHRPIAWGSATRVTEEGGVSL